MPRAPELSIVIPVFRSRDMIGPHVERLLGEFEGRASVEVVLVDDGNRDGTELACAALARSKPGLVACVRLGRNFGEHNAVMAGLRHSKGEYVVVMDDDGQHSPEDARRLYGEARQRGYDLVYSRFPERRHPGWRVVGSWFNGLCARWLLEAPAGLYLSSFKCMSRWLVDEVVRYEGPFPYVDALALRQTRNIGCVAAQHSERANGRSGYTLRKLAGLWLSMATSGSILPLRASSLLGTAFTVLAAGLSVQVLLEWLLVGRLPHGWAFLAVAILLFSGVQLLMLGIIGEYLGRVLLTANRVPQYSVREVIGSEGRLDPAGRER